MAEKAISSTFTVEGDTAVYSIKDAATGESRQFTLSLSALMANAIEAAKAIANGVRIRMREATGGKTFADAVALLDDFAASINGGLYPVRQREASETRSSPFIVALARCFYADDTKAAQAAFDAAVVDMAAQMGLDLNSEDEAMVKAVRSMKKKLREQMAGNKKVAAVLAQINAEAAAAAAQRAAAKAAAAAAAAEAGDDAS